MIPQHWGALVEIPKCLVSYPEEYGDLFLGTVVAHNKRRMEDNKICEFYFALFTRNRQEEERESNS